MIDPKVLAYSEKLKELGIEHTVVEHPELKEVLDVQKYLGLTLADGFSTLIMKADDNFVAIIRRDDCKLDLSKVKKILRVSSLRMADEREYSQITHVQVGTTRVINPGITTLLDQRLFEKEFLTGGSGSLTCSIRYKASDLKKIPNSKVVDISEVKGIEIIEGKRIVSGITPSGDGTLHIANYLGAVRQFKELAKTNECFLFIADLHALTTVQNKEQLQKNVETLILNELALLGDLTNITFYRQSDIHLHTELQSILNNVTPVGLLRRAHAYKDKLEKNMEMDDINMGLFCYPILMAADILLYKPDLVPVGKDQKQHIEITRDIAERFNKTFKKNVFVLPEPYIPEQVAVILGTDGKRKMSKSLGNIISIFEDENVIRKQVMGTFTDPTRIHATDLGHIEGNMVFSYLDYFGEKEKVDELKRLYREGKVPDIEVKNYLFESLMNFFHEARVRYRELSTNPDHVRDVLKKGAKRAREVASKTMGEVYETIGITNSYSFTE
jgi:tryptophanyl-tRNA synthetase